MTSSAWTIVNQPHDCDLQTCEIHNKPDSELFAWVNEQMEQASVFEQLAADDTVLPFGVCVDCKDRESQVRCAECGGAICDGCVEHCYFCRDKEHCQEHLRGCWPGDLSNPIAVCQEHGRNVGSTNPWRW